MLSTFLRSLQSGSGKADRDAYSTMIGPRWAALVGLAFVFATTVRASEINVDRLSFRVNYVMDAEKLQRASAVADGSSYSTMGAPEGIVALPSDTIVVQVSSVDSEGGPAYPDQAMLRFVDVSKAHPQTDTMFPLSPKRSDMRKDVALAKEVRADPDFWRADAVYKVEVIVGDPRLSKSFVWTVTDKFSFNPQSASVMAGKQRGVFDFDVSVKKTLLPEFITPLPPAEKEAATLVVQAFTLLSVLPLFGLLWAWSRLGVFPLRLPTAGKERLCLLFFQLCLVGHVGFLAMFWLKWNIVLTWQAIGLNMVPTLYFGHQVLSAKATRDYLAEKVN